VPIPADSQYVDERLENLYRSHLLVGEGSVASYYASGRGYYEPELAVEERDRFSICLVLTNGEAHRAGDHDRLFALQSISKVFVYGLALADHGGGYVLEHVGVEPSGDAFNSIVFDERNNRPYNPMVNAGALVTTDLVRGRDSAEKFERILGTAPKLCRKPEPRGGRAYLRRRDAHGRLESRYGLPNAQPGYDLGGR
jgi:glutaminase